MTFLSELGCGKSRGLSLSLRGVCDETTIAQMNLPQIRLKRCVVSSFEQRSWLGCNREVGQYSMNSGIWAFFMRE